MSEYGSEYEDVDDDVPEEFEEEEYESSVEGKYNEFGESIGSDSDEEEESEGEGEVEEEEVIIKPTITIPSLETLINSKPAVPIIPIQPVAEISKSNITLPTTNPKPNITLPTTNPKPNITLPTTNPKPNITLPTTNPNPIGNSLPALNKNLAVTKPVIPINNLVNTLPKPIQSTLPATIPKIKVPTAAPVPVETKVIIRNWKEMLPKVDGESDAIYEERLNVAEKIASADVSKIGYQPLLSEYIAILANMYINRKYFQSKYDESMEKTLNTILEIITL